MNFSRFLDIQSWWEVPSIAYFCSLFRTAFNLLDFDIEELEEALLTDGTEESASSLLTELIVRLLNGCLGNNDISAFNYQMYLRRLFRGKCQETGRYNPFNTDIDFQFLPLRTKVEILYALCDFRLDSSDVFDLFKNLEAESLRVEPLGWDDNDSAYWYFYGTRLYREDIIKKPKGKNKKRKSKESKKRGWFYGDDWLDDDETERVWQVVCFTEEDWIHLTDKFSKATSKVEKELYRSLSQNFLPEIPRLFQEKERLQRKRLLELAPRRTSSRVLQKIKQKEEDTKIGAHDSKDEEENKKNSEVARENRAKRRNLIRLKSNSSDTSESSESEVIAMPQKVSKRPKSRNKRSKNSSSTLKGEPPQDIPIKSGRKTNNSLACATGQIVIPDNEEPVNSTRKKLKTSQIFSQTGEDIQTDMYKVLEQLTAHEDAWPFKDPVDEEYAPNYYAVIRRPMDLGKMEERLDSGYYTDFSMFKADFKLIVNNCRLYNGQDNEYTLMVDNLQGAFVRLTEKYMHRLSSSDDEIAVEYQLPTPSRKHKLKSSESPNREKRKKRKSESDLGEIKSHLSDLAKDEIVEDIYAASPDPEVKKTKNRDKTKEKKKRKGHHRHGKHSRNHKKDSRKSEHSETFKSKHSKRQKHAKEKNKEVKKSKQKKKRSKHYEPESDEIVKQHTSQDSLGSSRSASPLPSIHTPSPSPTELEYVGSTDQLQDPDFYKDKYDKIKERRRRAAKEAWESLLDYKQKSIDKHKQNLHIPEKEKNQNLRETIEKLKAKNEKYMYSSGNCSTSIDDDNNCKNKESLCKVQVETDCSDNEAISQKVKVGNKKTIKKNVAKNESASEALEQAVKDISKWLDDAPKTSTGSSPCDSPAQTISTEDYENSRHDDEFSQGDNKLPHTRKEVSRKRPSSRDAKVVRRREVQRTIERLQPGKSKGNLLTNMVSKNLEKVEETSTIGTINKVRDVVKADESSPKLSLGSVLATVEFTLGNDHNFIDNENQKNEKTPDVAKILEKESESDDKKDEALEVKKAEEPSCDSTKKDTIVETEPPIPNKPSQEKATPNLSAWFKAFGAPKTTTVTTIKKKTDENEVDEKPAEASSNYDSKSISPKTSNKYESLMDPDTPNPEGGDSPLPNRITTPRQRRTSTGSSVSERSSFSQDLDSPRHQMSHTSPLLRSPASPRTDEFQKITYPILNGTVRAGFYQDTTSIKSSPDKSCSPREAPQSPYSPYSQHVYASNNVMGSSTPNYFLDHNKSPLPTYSQNPPPYYDTSKVPLVNKPTRVHDDYTALGPDSYQHNQYTGPFSPTQYPQSQSVICAQPQISPPIANRNTRLPHMTQVTTDPKTTLFPVKKRTYNEPDNSSTSTKKVDPRDTLDNSDIKNDFQKAMHSLHHSSLTSAGEIASELLNKPESTKIKTFRDKNPIDFIERHSVENRENITFNNNEVTEKKILIPNTEIAKPTGVIKKDNMDFNMDNLNSDPDRRNNPEKLNNDYLINKDVAKSSMHVPSKGYEVEAINLGLNNAHVLKVIIKSDVNSSNIPPAHTHERTHSDMNLSQNLSHTHNQYDQITGGQSIGNFSNDYLMNKDTVKSSMHVPSKGYEVEAINLGLNNAHILKVMTKSNVSSSNIPPAHTHERTHSDMNLSQNLSHAHHNQYDQITGGQSISNFSLNDIELANKKLYACNTNPSSSALAYGNWKLSNQIRKQDLPSDYSTGYNASLDKLKSDVNVSNSAPVNYNKNMQQYHNYNVPRSNVQRNQEIQQNLPSELRIPNPRGILKNDNIISAAISNNEMTSKDVETLAKTQKSEKNTQSHPLATSMPYKTSYSSHHSLPLDGLRNLPNIPQMLERYTNNDNYLSSFAANTSAIYNDKTFQMAQMFNKTATEMHSTSGPVSTYSQSSISLPKDNSMYKTSPSISTTQIDSKHKAKKKRITESKQSQIVGSQAYHTTSCSSDVMSSGKSSMVPGSAFNFGSTANMALGSGLYGDNGGFSLEDFRNTTAANQLMAANYMAAVAHQQQQRTNAEANAEKLVKPAHQNSNHTAGSFPFIGHSQVRTGYPFTEPSSPLYQQYLQRNREELLRQTGAQIMGLYPPGYPASLGVRQPYDSINRHSWL